jgi:hypothetical protein
MSNFLANRRSICRFYYTNKGRSNLFQFLASLHWNLHSPVSLLTLQWLRHLHFTIRKSLHLANLFVCFNHFLSLSWSLLIDCFLWGWLSGFPILCLHLKYQSCPSENVPVSISCVCSQNSFFFFFEQKSLVSDSFPFPLPLSESRSPSSCLQYVDQLLTKPHASGLPTGSSCFSLLLKFLKQN